MKNRMFHSSGAMLLAAVCLALAACGNKQAESIMPVPVQTPAAPQVQDPVHVLLTVPVGKEASIDLAEQLKKWKSSGAVTDALLLQQFDGPEAPGFSQLAVVDIADEDSFQNWKTEAITVLGPDVIIGQADVLADNAKKGRDSSKAVFVVSRYESHVSPEEYQSYTDAYIQPNMSNQKFSGIMTRYTMYLDREASGGLANPKALLLTEYANDAAFARKASVKDAYKKVLLETHPEWKRINETKTEIRTDLDETLARQVPLD